MYNEFNIYFEYYGMGNTSFNSDTYHQVTQQEISSMFAFAANNGYKKNDAFNIYIASGGAFFGGAAQAYNRVNVVSHYNFFTSEGVMVHEVGHCLNLIHTFNGWNAPGQSICEHVTRDENLVCDPNHPEIPCFNADVKGDRVVDTPAMPNFSIERCVELGFPPPYTDRLSPIGSLFLYRPYYF